MMLKIIVLVSIALLNLGCSEDIDYASLTPVQKAIHNDNRPNDDKDQDESRKVEVILNFAGIKPGDSVVDIYAGGGYYSELFSYLVGEKGQVYMQNGPRYISRHPDQVNERLEGARLSNVIRLDSADRNLMLPQNIDLVFISLAYHDLYVPGDKDINGYIKQIHNSLNKNGKLIIIDHSAVLGTGSNSAKSLHRIDEQHVVFDMQRNGFKLVSSDDALRNMQDDRNIKIFKEPVKGKTDKFILMFGKAN